MKRCALLLLTATAPAVYSARAATEGGHRTLHHPSGAALLGWAASEERYGRFGDPFAVFHSGRVRFSNALPIASSGRPAYPIPRLLMEPKHSGGGMSGGKLDDNIVRVGRPSDEVGRDELVQYEPLKPGFVTAAGEVIKSDLGERLRTATFQGRAAAGQLFGYQHIKSDARPRYAATIEAAENALGDDREWRRLLGAFDKRTIWLGRASGTSYGGGYECEVRDGEGADLWPKGKIPLPGDAMVQRVRVWALSDLALTDDYGAPCFAPGPGLLGLPPSKGRFVGADSAIGVRRYAPWNRKLQGRDVERQVIEAGSVLSFEYEADAIDAAATFNEPVGLWQESGLGRIWVNPPMLRAGTPAIDENAPPIATPENPRRVAPQADPLVNWAIGQAENARRRAEAAL